MEEIGSRCLAFSDCSS